MEAQSRKEVAKATSFFKTGSSRLGRNEGLTNVRQDLAFVKSLLKKHLKFHSSIDEDAVNLLRNSYSVLLMYKMVRSMLTRMRVEHKIFQPNRCLWTIKRLDKRQKIALVDNKQIGVHIEKVTECESKTEKSFFKRYWRKRQTLLQILDFNFF